MYVLQANLYSPNVSPLKLSGLLFRGDREREISNYSRSSCGILTFKSLRVGQEIFERLNAMSKYTYQLCVCSLEIRFKNVRISEVGEFLL